MTRICFWISVPGRRVETGRATISAYLPLEHLYLGGAFAKLFLRLIANGWHNSFN
jgi:hypothetical protein